MISYSEVDGSDLIDLGAGGWVDYSLRTAPLTMHGNQIGAEGEVDTIVGSATVDGGSGDDLLAGNKVWMTGGPGNDVLISNDKGSQLEGEEGDDRLRGGGGDDQLQGGPGSDVLEGGRGDDTIEERAEPYPEESEANVRDSDVANSGAGDDEIKLGPGDDRATGGPGEDRIYARDGDDVVSGDGGADVVTGDGGADWLSGGAGRDLLRAGRVDEGPESSVYVPPDLAVDAVDCGPGRDRAQVNAWDRPLTGCERRKLVRQVQIASVRYDLEAGTALLTLEAIRLGNLDITGPGCGASTTASARPAGTGAGR